MWTKPLQEGGVVGDNNFPIAGNTWFEGSAYNQRYGNPIIVAGLLIYTEPISFYSPASLGGSGVGPTNCVDLRTGELKWSKTDIPQLSFAIIYDVEDPQQHGVYPAMLVQVSGSPLGTSGTHGQPISWSLLPVFPQAYHRSVHKANT